MGRSTVLTFWKTPERLKRLAMAARAFGVTGTTATIDALLYYAEVNCVRWPSPEPAAQEDENSVSTATHTGHTQDGE